MTIVNSDALVFFGATGDLAYKKIFPALQAIVKRGHLEVPVIGVAQSAWNLEQFRARAKESVGKHGGLDPAAFDRLCGRSGGESLASIGPAGPDGHIVVRVGIDGGDNV